MPTQYVAVQFAPWDRKSYTYANPGEPVAVGDTIIVPSPKGDQKVEVVGVGYDVPPFACKEIVGKAPL